MIPILPHTLPETINYPAVPLRRPRLRLQPRLHHVQRVAADPASHARQPSREQHCPERLAPALPAARVEPLPRVLVRREVDPVGRGVPQHRDGQAPVQAPKALRSEYAPGHVPWASGGAEQLEADLDQLDRAEDEALDGARAEAAESNSSV